MIAFDTAVYGGFDLGVPSKTYSHTCTGTELILVVMVWTSFGAKTVTGITYNGVALTEIGTDVDDATGNRHLAVWYLVGPATGAHNIVITLNTTGNVSAISASYTGASQTGQPDSTAAQPSTSTGDLITSTTTVANNSWTILMVGSLGGIASTGGTGTTVRFDEFNDLGLIYADSNGPISPAGSSALELTNASSQEYFGRIISISPSAGTVKTVNGLAKANVKTWNGLA
jgi:hypothetical protein